MLTRAQVGTVKPNPRFHGHTSPIFPIPKSHYVALSNPNWRNAMYDEYNALIKNSTWVLVLKPPNVNVVRSMWLFRHKYHADGSLSRYKDRLVANGRSQQFGVDCDDTFSPVVKPATVHTVLSLALSRNWPIHQFDVKNAFLNGDLSKTVYMYQPPGYANRVSFSSSRCDSSLFIYQQGYEVANLLIYVDDIVLTASFTNLLQLDTESKLGSDGDPISEPTSIVVLRVAYSTLHLLVQISLMQCNSTLDFGHQLYASATGSLVAYTNADWAGCPTTRRSTSGYCVFLGDNLLSWSAKRQHTLSRSSAE
nr:ribonuclease H-like domain-containing protein [Tanacetum cinerariifolium]